VAQCRESKLEAVGAPKKVTIMPGQPHVVILGAGFAGVSALKRLRDADVRITLVSNNDYQTFQPLIYQVATAELAPTQVGFPVRDLLHGHTNVTFHKATVTGVDLANKRVTADGVASLDYDYLVLGLGAVVNFFNTPGAAEHALPLYTMDDAIRLRRHFLTTFEAVDKNPELIADGALTICIVGGGPTGVELAGALADLLHSELERDYPNLPVLKARVILYEHSPNVLGMFKPRLQVYARKQLEARGVEVQTGTGVTQVGPGSICLSNGETVRTHTLVWAAGLQANPVVRSLGIATVHGNRIPVGPDLQVQGHTGVFAVGDIAAITDSMTGKVLPGLGSVALQAGRHVGDSIKHLAAGQVPEPFHYFDKGTMAQVGTGAAVAELPFGATLTGHVAWLAWLGIHLALLNGSEEKVSTFVDWGWNLLTGHRAKRIILTDEENVEPADSAHPGSRPALPATARNAAPTISHIAATRPATPPQDQTAAKPPRASARSSLVVLRFDTPDGAEKGLELAAKLQREQLLELLDAATVSWPKGKRKPKTRHVGADTCEAACDGAFWGLLFGWIFFVPFVGAAFGAAIGALAEHFAEHGISGGFLEQVRSKVTEGSSALFLFLGYAATDRIIEAFKVGPKFEIIATNLSAEQDEKLNAAFAHVQ
jgi:NADH dehydrogenase